VHRGLVFVCIVPSNAAFAGLLRVKGVAAMVGKDGIPYPIGNREMNVFMELAQAGAFDERNTPAGLVVGSRVRINVGPYAEMDGILTGYAPGRPARVLTWLFGGEIVVDVTLAHLEKLE
jgi:transcription antitermination factor NusG